MPLSESRAEGRVVFGRELQARCRRRDGAAKRRRDAALTGQKCTTHPRQNAQSDDQPKERDPVVLRAKVARRDAVRDSQDEESN